ncbi:MAG: hydrogenase maturation protease [Chloroflexaceae bacterium]|nr:hydrogenase maturation protease [Chloroflexaceae bacterium]
MLVIGYGNPLRGDDGVGWHAARCLEERYRERRDARVHYSVVACHQLTPELAEPVSRSALVLFIDACLGAPAGTLACQTIAPPPTPAPPGAFLHHLTPPSLLAWAQWCYGSCPARAMLLTVAGANFGYTEALSPPVQAALPRLLNLVATLIP